MLTGFFTDVYKRQVCAAFHVPAVFKYPEKKEKNEQHRKEGRRRTDSRDYPVADEIDSKYARTPAADGAD